MSLESEIPLEPEIAYDARFWAGLDPEPVETYLRWRGLKEFERVLKFAVEKHGRIIIPFPCPPAGLDNGRSSRFRSNPMVPNITRLLPATAWRGDRWSEQEQHQAIFVDTYLQFRIQSWWYTEVQKMYFRYWGDTPPEARQLKIYEASEAFSHLAEVVRQVVSLKFTTEILELFANPEWEPVIIPTHNTIVQRELRSFLAWAGEWNGERVRLLLFEHFRAIADRTLQAAATSSQYEMQENAQVLKDLNLALSRYDDKEDKMNIQGIEYLQTQIQTKIAEIERLSPTPWDRSEFYYFVPVEGVQIIIPDKPLWDFLGKPLIRHS